MNIEIKLKFSGTENIVFVQFEFNDYVKIGNDSDLKMRKGDKTPLNNQSRGTPQETYNQRFRTEQTISFEVLFDFVLEYKSGRPTNI